jgi:hypothetical protein
MGQVVQDRGAPAAGSAISKQSSQHNAKVTDMQWLQRNDAAVHHDATIALTWTAEASLADALLHGGSTSRSLGVGRAHHGRQARAARAHLASLAGCAEGTSKPAARALQGEVS